MILKKIIAFEILILSLCFIQSSFAEDLKLKRSCLKKNPIMQGIYDPNLISIYKQVCDKNNKDNKNTYLIQAAQRFNALGLNDHAMQLIGMLEAQKISNQSLTDVKFLVGTRLANDALQTMREKELRYLSEDVTYPAAKELMEAIQHALPSRVLVEQAPKVTRPVPVSAVKVQDRLATVKTPRPRPVPSVSAPPRVRPLVPQVKPAAKPTTPFSNL